ncbi:glycerol-3-phosphate responsive antiterminator [Tetragenococcus halophilus]|uniref:glycerol-3-phosphate responsive antiterminator n=1 Tax=Tetragenococcus halophilus TaxID=51669 RepID=UPI0015B7E553|nr:glycerol-3-phosphate responsive antiterminator [Tetragenococcus halophilus]NWN99665.1 glycerol-3-phosphate responsive antiterminator [Tetragenococcus halophilus]
MQLKKTVIPSVREPKFLTSACKTTSPIVLLSNSNIGNLKSQVEYVHKNNKQAFAHLELIDGFSPDVKGIKLLKNMYSLDGVFTTNIQAGSIAKNIGLTVVYRFFLIDSRSLKRTANILTKNNFDAIEILPAYSALQEFEHLKQIGGSQELIVGGFVKDSKLMEKIFEVEISGITTSTTDLWQFRKER